MQSWYVMLICAKACTGQWVLADLYPSQADCISIRKTLHLAGDQTAACLKVNAMNSKGTQVTEAEWVAQEYKRMLHTQ